MKNPRILGPLGLLIICALIDKSKSLPTLDLRNGAVETIVGDTKDDGKCSGANIILADGHVGHNTDLSSKIVASNDRRIGAQRAEPKGNAGLGTEHEPDMVLPSNAVETKDEFFDTAEQFPSQDSSSTSGQSSRTNPMKMKEKNPQDVGHSLEGVDKSILPGEDSSSLSDQPSKTNTMIEDDFTPTPDKIIEKEQAKNSRHNEPRLLPNLARLEVGSDMALPSHAVEKQEEFFDAAEKFARRHRRKKTRPVKKAHFEEIEETFPGDWELEEENTDTHPVVKTCRAAFVVSLIGSLGLMPFQPGAHDPLAKIARYQGHNAARSGRNDTPWISGNSAPPRGTLSIA